MELKFTHFIFNSLHSSHYLKFAYYISDFYLLLTVYKPALTSLNSCAPHLIILVHP